MCFVPGQAFQYSSLRSLGGLDLAKGAVCARTSVDNRWRGIFGSGCRSSSWQQEARQCADWLGKELGGGLVKPVVGACQDSTTTASRKVVVEQLEDLRSEVLKKVLSQYPVRTARPV